MAAAFQHRVISSLFLVVTVMSCDRETATAPRDPDSPTASQVGSLVARALSLAMADHQIRQQILSDMRVSLVSEHKLVLQDYFATGSGQRVLDAIRGAGVDADNLGSILQSMRPIQFYVPSTNQRSNWRGSADILVTSLIQGRPTIAFAPTGDSVALSLDANTQLASNAALFFVEWAEPMYNRWSGFTAATETIQLTGESQIGGGMVVKDASGNIISTTDDAPAGASRGSPSATAAEPGGTYLTYFQNRGAVCDHQCTPFESIEVEFRATTSSNPNTYIARLTGIPQDPRAWWQGLKLIHPARVPAGNEMTVQVWETDDGGDEAFYCISQDAACTPEITHWPYMSWRSPFPSSGLKLSGPLPAPVARTVWDFKLCEGDWEGCTTSQGYIYEDFAVTFTDRAPSVVSTVTITPDAATIKKGPTYALSVVAEARDQYGDRMDEKTPTWTSSNSNIAAVVPVSEHGALVYGWAAGQATIAATVDGVSGTTSITVLAPTTLTIAPAPSSVCLSGTAALTATVKDQQANIWTDGSVTWSSSNNNVVSVSASSSRSATASGVASGQATITATLDGVYGTSTATVAPCLPAPTSCQLQWIPTPKYLLVSWNNADASASTQVEIQKSGGGWQLVWTASPGSTQHNYSVGTQTGFFTARVRHTKPGYGASNYCTTGGRTVP